MLRTVRAIVDAGLPLPVHIGVSEGRVFTGQVGASFRRTYTVLGDTAALAARLMARAGRGRDLGLGGCVRARRARASSRRSSSRSASRGRASPSRRSCSASCWPEPRARSRLAQRTSCRSSIASGSVRSSAASVAPVRMGFGTLVELVGEPGIGKSRLAEELRENCADMRQVSLRCEQYEASTPYYPFRPFLRSLLDVELNGGGQHNRAVLAERLASVDEELVPWAPLLAAPLDVEVETTPGGGRPRPGVLACPPARSHGHAARPPARLADPARLRRRPLDGRCVVRAAPLPRDAAPDEAVAHVHDATAGRGRIRSRRGNAAAPRTDAAPRAAPRRRCEDARAGRGR